MINIFQMHRKTVVVRTVWFTNEKNIFFLLLHISVNVLKSLKHLCLPWIKHIRLWFCTFKKCFRTTVKICIFLLLNTCRLIVQTNCLRVYFELCHLTLTPATEACDSSIKHYILLTGIKFRQTRDQCEHTVQRALLKQIN